MEKIIKELEQKKNELLNGIEVNRKEIETIDKAIKLLSNKDISPAEKWALETIDGVKPKTKPNGNVEWYNKDGKLIFTQDFKNGVLWVSYLNIWDVLENEFGLNDDERRELLNNLLYDYTDNGKLKL